jgi:hypothetical protein
VRVMRLLILVGLMAVPLQASAGGEWRAPGPAPIVPEYHFGPGQPMGPPIVPRYHFGAEPAPVFGAPPPFAPHQAWVPGYWDLSGSTWVWVEGAWVAPPNPGFFWIPPHWAPVANRWYWEGGHWAAPGEQE